MKILFIGDIVGRPGREAVAHLLPKLKTQTKAELAIANGENAAGGSGMTPQIVYELFDYGVDVITSGDHIWKKREILEVVDTDARLLRPANYPDNTPGIGFTVVKTPSHNEVGVINVVGRVFMAPLECPFKAARQGLEKIKKKTPIVIVDIHAEATSEKMAMGWYLDGEASAVLGTHTHIQTADEHILPNGTAYITDVGMTGPYHSVLGRRVEQVLERFLTQMPVRFEVATEDVQLHGVVLDIDPKTGKANSIERIRRKLQ